MFKSKKKQNELLRTKISTLIGEDSVVEGIVKFSGGLHIVGKVMGGVISEADDSLLIISESGHVSGDVVVKHVIVNGQIDGEIHVNGKVELFDKARINGDIHYKVLELPVGAEVNGQLIRIDESN